MIASKLMKVLACPATLQIMRVASVETLKQLNEAIAAGNVRNTAGVLLQEPVEEGLIREDCMVLYPVRKDIPMMLENEGIQLPVGGAS